MLQLWDFPAPGDNHSQNWEELKAAFLPKLMPDILSKNGDKDKDSEPGESNKASIPEIKVTPPSPTLEPVPSSNGIWNKIVSKKAIGFLSVPERKLTARNRASKPVRSSKRSGNKGRRAPKPKKAPIPRIRALAPIRVSKQVTSSVGNKGPQIGKPNKLSIPATKVGPPTPDSKALSGNVWDFLLSGDDAGQVWEELKATLKKPQPKTASNNKKSGDKDVQTKKQSNKKSGDKEARAEKLNTSSITEVKVAPKQDPDSKPVPSSDEAGNNEPGLEKPKKSWMDEAQSAPDLAPDSELVLSNYEAGNDKTQLVKPNVSWVDEVKAALKSAPVLKPNPTISWDFWADSHDCTPAFKVIHRTGFEILAYPMAADYAPPANKSSIAVDEERGYQFGNWREDLPYESFNEGPTLSSSIRCFRCVYGRRGSSSDSSLSGEDTDEGDEWADAKAYQ